MKPLVSIIVPVYNAAGALRRCVDSVLEQEYQELELLLIDDGSTDESASICDAYTQQDSRVKVIHRKNSGVSATRNCGIAMAKGVYVQFLDSDDWITRDATASLVQTAEKTGCDMVIADFYRVIGERLSPKGAIDEDGVMSREEYAEHMMENPADFYYGVLWNKLYRKEIIDQYSIRMDVDVSWCEDFLFNLDYIRHANTFCALQVPVYYYVKTKGSLVNQGISLSKTVKMKRMVFSYYQKFFQDVLEEEEYEKCRLKVLRFLLDAAGDGTVAPSVMPGSFRLGSERFHIRQELLEAKGELYDVYRSEKLLQHCLETTALKYDLAVEDAQLLLVLDQVQDPMTRQELADICRRTRSGLSAGLQHLSAKGYLSVLEVRQDTSREKRLCAMPTETAEPVLRELQEATEHYQELLMKGFSNEERMKYQELCRRMYANVKNRLS